MILLLSCSIEVIKRCIKNTTEKLCLYPRGTLLSQVRLLM